MKTASLLRTIWVVAGLALILGLVRDPILARHPREELLPLANRNAPSTWFAGDFRIGGAYFSTTPGLLPAGIPTAGSWVDSDAWQGRSETVWFTTSARTVTVAVVGYPQNPGCRLWAEFRDRSGAITTIFCPLANPGERWNLWEIHPPTSADAMRIVGEDRSSASGGWLAFSHPFHAWPATITAAYQGLQLFATTALAFTLIWGPGLLWRSKNKTPETRTVVLLGLGPLTLALLGVAIWIAGAWVAPPQLALGLVTTAWIAIGFTAQRRNFSPEFSPALLRVLSVSSLLVVAVVAKSTYSVGPQGELFRGTVSRNFELADRIDSRFSFYTVQAAARHQGPGAPATDERFAPWTFFSRGPLAGLASLPIVLATGGRPSGAMPEDRWSPFDRTGFAAYRVTMIVLASGIIVALFLILVPLVGEGWAAAAAGLLALSPFGVHEMLFTWPKWTATAWVATSFSLAHARRPLGAGLTLAIGFLFHPLALLWSPWIGLWAAGRHRGPRARSLALIRFAAGAGVLVLPWWALGTWMPHQPSAVLAGQGGFLRYWTMADWQPATWATWWHTRWMNFANTFVPLHGYLADASFNHPKLSSTYEASGRLVKFAELWWTSLPLAAGLGVWAWCSTALVRSGRELAAAAILFVIAPALFAVGYWGMDPLGLMRECGHPLLAALIALGCVVAVRHGGRLQTVLRHRAVPWLQLPETWLMLWLTTWSNSAPSAAEFYQLDPLYLTINTLALVAAAWVVSRERNTLPAPTATGTAAEEPRPALLAPLHRRVILAGVIVCGLLYAIKAVTERRSPAFANIAARTEGAFQRDGHFLGEPLTRVDGAKVWGSWCGDDVNTGRLVLGPFAAPSTLQLALSGYPALEGLHLYLERTDTLAQLPLQPLVNIGERWRIADFSLPEAWVGKSVTLVARDEAKQSGGWLAVSEPLRGGYGTGNADLFATLAAWAINGLLYGLLGWAALRWLHARAWLAPEWLPLAAAALVAVAGYLAFWAYVASATCGMIYSSVVLLLGLIGALRRGPREEKFSADSLAAPKLIVVIGVFYLALLHLFPSAREFHDLAANRLGALPGDNTLPHNTARDLFNGVSLKSADADWLSSDRPPLQAGWLLLVRHVTTRLDLDERTTDGTAAVWLQLIWVCAAYGLLRRAGLARPRAAAWTALLAFTGFFLLNSVFTWPKLCAAAFVAGAWALWFGTNDQAISRRDAILGALFAGLAWLAHGGAAFSLLALVPWLIWRAGRSGGRTWAFAVVAFAVLAAPWSAYQKFYDPPGNRLLKWHLGGQIDKNPRGAWETIQASYQALPWSGIVERKISNLKYQISGDWSWWRDFSPAHAAARRTNEFLHTGQALTWWLIGLVALPLAWAVARRRVPWSVHLNLTTWAIGTTLLWCALMFIKDSAMIHQGSYATLLVFFVVLSAWCEFASRWSVWIVATLQAATFLATWTPGSPALRVPLNPTALAIMIVAIVGVGTVVVCEARVRNAN